METWLSQLKTLTLVMNLQHYQMTLLSSFQKYLFNSVPRCLLQLVRAQM